MAPAACLMPVPRGERLEPSLQALGPPDWTSSLTSWRGFRLDRWSLASYGQRWLPASQWPVLWLCTGGVARLARDADWTAVPPALSSVHFGLAGQPECRHLLCWKAPVELWSIELDPGCLTLLADQAAAVPRAGLADHFGIADPRVASLFTHMRCELDSGCASGPLYGQGLSLALLSHLAARYGARPSPGEGQAGSAAGPDPLAQVCEYIRTHLSEELPVRRLAREVGLSPRHFVYLFKARFGQTPHAHVLLARVREAQRRLAVPQASIVEVALALGFASQSHFTEVFHKVTGTTPGRYQRRTQVASPRRQVAGGSPNSRLNARLNAASDS